jgi:crotonobetainyl-CoA:carnitine CoA-transferase CaiB-like acyl-CoA transferase
MHHSRQYFVSRQFGRERPVAKCLAMLDKIDLPCGKAQKFEEVLVGPQSEARTMVVEQEHPVLGRVQLGNLPFHFPGCDTTIRTPAPLLGQHNREIAESLGYTEVQIETIIAEAGLYAEEVVDNQEPSPRDVFPGRLWPPPVVG